MLTFQKITLENLPEILPFFNAQEYRICDFSAGGLYMWVQYFDYQYCIDGGVLYIRGNDTDDPARICYSLPLGADTIAGRIEKLLRNTEDGVSGRLVLNTIPELVLPEILRVFDCTFAEMENWADYLYDANQLALLVGRKYNKKRNRINQFKKNFPDHVYERITDANIGEVAEFFEQYLETPEESVIGRYENDKVAEVLARPKAFPFEGGLIRVSGSVVAFTFGEAVGDTLQLHIEKADRNFEGAYQTIFQSFLNDVIARENGIKFVNREEDVGDPGLRTAKLSYFPLNILKKYRIEVHGIL